jgi:hypothetical protein
MSVNRETLSLADDLLHGVRPISEFVYGKIFDEKEAERNVRRAYHAISKGDIPIFRIGGVICARKSSILERIAEQERIAEDRILRGGSATEAGS